MQTRGTYLEITLKRGGILRSIVSSGIIISPQQMGIIILISIPGP